MKNPQSCPICRAHWDFKLDYLARVIAVHPITKCVPAAAVYEKEDEEVMDLNRECEECRKVFKPKRAANGTHRLCSAECRKARRERKKVADAKAWKLKVLKQFHLPTRTCIECGKPFTISSKFSVKQLICSTKCRLVRDNKRKRAA